MKKTIRQIFVLLIGLLPLSMQAQEPIYEMPSGSKTRWISFENKTGTPGMGAMENKGAKGHPYDWIPAGSSAELLYVEGSGTIRRIWLTMSDRSPEMLRSLRLDMYWDGAATPAVSAPLGDFFGPGLGQKRPFENAFFSDPEGRSFNCIAPMPFRRSARIVLTNESERNLDMIFYDIDYTLDDPHSAGMLYFHAWWQRNPATTPGVDFEILPRVNGRGRFLGTSVGLRTDPRYGTDWWGEGEVKMYLDGDGQHPTLSGTGTEDYIGTAYGQGIFNHRYQGCLFAGEDRQWAFYRFHVPDPVYFHSDIRVTIQQMGGAMRQQVIARLKDGVPLIPVTMNASQGKLIKLLEHDPPLDIEKDLKEENWVNYYRSDDVSAVAYFYLDRPENGLPALQPLPVRTASLVKKP
jgi:hypothetical protein